MSSPSSTQAAVADDKVCYLLDKLPAEIRNTIWELSFVHTGWLYLLDAKIKYWPPSHDLLATCSQIHKEVKGLYSRAQQRYWQDTSFVGLYGEDNTLFHETRELITSIPAEKFNHIQHLQFVLDRNRDYTVYTMLFAKGAGWMADLRGKILFMRMAPATDTGHTRIDSFSSEAELKEACENAPAGHSVQEQALLCGASIEEFWIEDP